jgi:nitroreductase
MKDVFEAIYERRSQRRFTGRTVSYDKLKAIANAGLHAPTVNDLRDLEFVIVNDGRKITTMSDNADDQTWIRNAGGLIAVISNPQRLEAYQDDAYEYIGRHVGAAMQNMSLAAHALNLGSCWVERYNDDDVERLFSSPPENEFGSGEDERLEAVLVVGYPDGKPGERPPYQPSNHIFFDEYEERLERHKYMRGQYYEELKKIGYNLSKDTSSLLDLYKRLVQRIKELFD